MLVGEHDHLVRFGGDRQLPPLAVWVRVGVRVRVKGRVRVRVEVRGSVED